MTTNHVDVREFTDADNNSGNPIVSQWAQNDMQRIISHDSKILKIICDQARKLITDENRCDVNININQFYHDDGLIKRIREGIVLEVTNDNQLFSFDVDSFEENLDSIIISLGSNTIDTKPHVNNKNVPGKTNNPELEINNDKKLNKNKGNFIFI